ncbi:MAG: hypothetical protein RLZ98_2110 [Pseudomonadota bacterium]|jgi:tRNA dimethylallyltransferase
MTEPPRRTILIAGPTASGKSALALCLARRLGGTVINADSMQVYCELRIVTARPSPADEASVPHALYGFVPSADAYSAGRYGADAAAAVAAARSAGRVPIVVGGTGLYFRTLLQGLSAIPPVPEEVRAKWRSIGAEVDGSARLYEALAQLDPAMAARLAPGDRQRVTRALEVLEATGRSLAHWQAEPGAPILTEDETVRLWLDLDRSRLYHRVGERLEGMIAAGALDEVGRLLSLGLDPGLPAMRAVGVPEFARHLAGELSIDEALDLAKIATRQYVKRQMTWARRNMCSWKHINAQDMQRIFDGDVTLIDSPS